MSSRACQQCGDLLPMNADLDICTPCGIEDEDERQDWYDLQEELQWGIWEAAEQLERELG